MTRQWYEKYRWFFTSSGKVVIGGKSAEQNEDVVKNHIQQHDIVMHTAEAGSPFAIIKTEGSKICGDDLHEAAIFTASFSRAWRKGKKQAETHIFKPEQIMKEKNQKQGTFAVLGKIQKAMAELKLALTVQKGKLRAVPKEAAQEIFCTIKPGKTSKENAVQEIAKILQEENLKFSREEILNALPTGKFRISEA
jgi:hypothetical protein